MIGNSATSGIGSNSGGGIWNAGTLTALDSTVSHNSSAAGGSGIGSTGSLTVMGSTIVFNSASGQGAGAGIYQQNLAFAIGNTIVAQNATLFDSPDVAGEAHSLGHNLIGQTGSSFGWVASDLNGTQDKPIDPRLAPLGQYGGPTPTLVPLAGSPALGAGSAALLAKGESTDQRGLPRIAHGVVDIGSVQTQGPSGVQVTAPGSQTFTASPNSPVALGSFTASARSGPFLVDVDWGDGSAHSDFTVRAPGSLGRLGHHFTSSRQYRVQIAITNPSGDLSNDALSVIVITPAPTRTVVVNTNSDYTHPAGGSFVSLRDAVALANQSFGPVSITFDPVAFPKLRRIILSGSQLELKDNFFGPISVIAPTAGLIISGNDVSRVLLVNSGIIASISGITFEHGNTDHASDTEYGASIENAGALTLLNCIVSNNADSVAAGGGINNDGMLTVDDCTVENNTTSGGDGGGGIRNVATLTLSNTVIAGNKTTITAGGGLYNSGKATITDCTFTANQAMIDEIGYGGSGGAIFNSGTLALTNSTISANSSDGSGGGIENTGVATLSSCTISGNSGGGIDSYADASLTLANTIVAGNLLPGTPTDPDVSAIFQSLGFNLIGVKGDSDGWAKSDLLGSVDDPLDPKLAPLDDYGGPTPTQPPLPGSPAIDGGSVAWLGKGVMTDQRGYPRVANKRVDIGAVEVQRAGVISITPASSQQVVGGNATLIRLGSFSDRGGTGPFHVNVNWGDGSANSHFTLSKAGSLSALQHRFINTGALTVTVFVRDAEGDLSSAAFGVASATHSLVHVVVNTTKDQVDPAGSTTVSLRDAVNIASQSIGPVAITFDATIFAKAQTVSLSNSGLSFAQNDFGLITLNAPAAGLVLEESQVQSVDTVLSVASGVSLQLSGITITGAGDSGVHNSGTLSLSKCVITGNQGLYGGGIYNDGTMTIADSVVSRNSSFDTAGFMGGRDGGLGGGIYNLGALTLSAVGVVDNHADQVGGGIYSGDGTLTVDATYVARNDASGIVSNGTLTMTRSTVCNNAGDELGASNSATLVNCTVLGSANDPTSGDYAIGTSSDMTLTNCTIMGIRESGVSAVPDNGTCTVANCIISNVDGTVTSLDHNVIGFDDGSNTWSPTDRLGTPDKPLDPKLSVLGWYGGPVPTEVPLPGSPALGAGSAALLPPGTITDARGLPRVIHGRVDAGAVQTRAR